AVHDAGQVGVEKRVGTQIAAIACQERLQIGECGEVGGRRQKRVADHYGNDVDIGFQSEAHLRADVVHAFGGGAFLQDVEPVGADDDGDDGGRRYLGAQNFWKFLALRNALVIIKNVPAAQASFEPFVNQLDGIGAIGT